MTRVTIRVLGADDVDAFRRIRLEALRCEPAAFTSSAQSWEALSDFELRRRLDEIRVFAAFLGDDPIGIMGLMRQPAAKTAHRATVKMVYVRATMRGLGVSTDLLETLTSEARRQGIRQLELSVNGENEAALRFYRRKGFVEVGRIPGGFLLDGKEVDEIVMARRIAC